MEYDRFAPVKMRASFKDYLWGGRRLIEEYNKKTDLDIAAESWELSCHDDGPSFVAEGKFEGKTLGEYVEIIGGKTVLGTKADKFDYFPLLIKFIDAKNNLSIQVHPNDEYALRVEGEYGKTEMWYVLDAADGAYLYYGFNRDITRDELADRIKNNTILEVLNKVSVKKGDVFFIEAGTVHAICGGIVICEIQQNSNTTYRVYDYDRRDKNGNARPLHIDKALDVANLRKADYRAESAEDGVLAKCEYFTVKRIGVCEKITEKLTEESFCAVIAVDGEGTMKYKNTEYRLQKGDTYFVPAQESTLEFDGKCEIIISRL